MLFVDVSWAELSRLLDERYNNYPNAQTVLLMIVTTKDSGNVHLGFGNRSTKAGPGDFPVWSCVPVVFKQEMYPCKPVAMIIEVSYQDSIII